MGRKKTPDTVGKSAPIQGTPPAGQGIEQRAPKKKMRSSKFDWEMRPYPPFDKDQVIEAIRLLHDVQTLCDADRERIAFLATGLDRLGWGVVGMELQLIAGRADFRVVFQSTGERRTILMPRAMIDHGGVTKSESFTREKPKTVADAPRSVADLLHMPATVTRDELNAVVAKAMPNLSEEQRHNLLENAYKLDAEAAAVASFKRASALQPLAPMKWIDAPKSLKIVEFLRMEYRDKGLLSDDFNRKSLALMDEHAANAVASYTRYKALPKDIDIPKAVNRKNEREKAGLDVAENWNRRKPQ